MLSARTKRNISRILPFGIIWLIFSVAYSLLEKGILGNLDHYPSTGNPYTFSQSILITPISSLIAGLIIGTCEIVYFNKWFTQKSFTKKIVYKSLTYLAIIIAFLIATSLIAQSVDLNVSIFNKQAWSYAMAFLFSFAFFSIVVYMATAIVVTLFYSEVSENIGHNVLNNFFRGKYHSPTEEERIFMFLDMRSSSAIAENLGHVKYFEMLREYYSDMSESIIDHSGEIYQYVGDEIIVSWRLAAGQKDNNCIRCFFAIQDAFKKQRNKYMERFGVLPGFKAGLHVGKVTTGEMGDLKKEITFTGDILNATSRIQGLCNTYHVDLIISGDLKNRLSLHGQFEIISLGENELRGKEEKIELFSLRTNQP